MTPRVLFVGRTRYRLPLADSLARMLLGTDRPAPFTTADMNEFMTHSPSAWLATRAGDWWVFDFTRTRLYPTRAITIARFKVLSFHKQRRHDPIRFSEPLLDALDQISAEMAQQPTDLQQALEDCLARLEDADRDLFRRRYQPGVTVPQLAADMGRPATTVYHTLDRIRRALVGCVERRLSSEGRS